MLGENPTVTHDTLCPAKQRPMIHGTLTKPTTEKGTNDTMTTTQHLPNPPGTRHLPNPPGTRHLPNPPGTRHLRIIERRAKYLQNRIAACPKPDLLAYDEAELKALKWAIGILHLHLLAIQDNI